MLDLAYIIQHQKEVEKAAYDKGVAVDIKSLVRAAEDRKRIQSEIELLNRRRNETADAMRNPGARSQDLISAGRELKAKLAQLEPQLRAAEQRVHELMLTVPNIPSQDTPIGAGESANRELRRAGSVPDFSFVPKDHEALGTALGILDLGRGVKTAGFRGYFLKGDLARLHWAVLTYAFKTMIGRGYLPFISPSLVNDTGLIASGWFPMNTEDVYSVDGKYLAGTAEIPMLAYHANEIIELAGAPKKYAGFSPCFRREAGSYGRDAKGLYRVHEFWKVEQIIFCEADHAISDALFDELLAIAEQVVRDLQLPYRVLQIGTGDMGLGKYKMYDIEVWMPSRAAYGETHSCSHFTDWQARRLNVRYRDSQGALRYPHTLNNTVIASPRILIALLENYQNADGTIRIPSALQPLMGGQTLISLDTAASS